MPLALLLSLTAWRELAKSENLGLIDDSDLVRGVDLTQFTSTYKTNSPAPVESLLLGPSGVR